MSGTLVLERNTSTRSIRYQHTLSWLYSRQTSRKGFVFVPFGYAMLYCTTWDNGTSCVKHFSEFLAIAEELIDGFDGCLETKTFYGTEYGGFHRVSDYEFSHFVCK